MKTILFFGVALSILTLNSCQLDNRESAQQENPEEPPAKKEYAKKMITKLVGEWEQAGSGDNGQENAIQTLTFTEEARYIVRAGNQKTDSGAYRMNEQLQNLYLESEATKNPREFEIQLTSDTLILSAKEGSQQEEEQVYVKRN